MEMRMCREKSRKSQGKSWKSDRDWWLLKSGECVYIVCKVIRQPPSYLTADSSSVRARAGKTEAEFYSVWKDQCRRVT